MTVYDSYGNEVEPISAIYSGKPVADAAELTDHGREPDFTKESLIGKKITVYGIVGPEQWTLGSAYFLLIKREEDAAKDDPWGIMFPAGSPVITTALAAHRQKKMPFTGILQRTTSESEPSRSYWHWARR